MSRRNFRLLITLALLGGAQSLIGWPRFEYTALADAPAAPICEEPQQGVDPNDLAAICEARQRADAERASCAQNLPCKHEWRDLIEAWEGQRASINKASRQ
jgi:hypothetical protein